MEFVKLLAGKVKTSGNLLAISVSPFRHPRKRKQKVCNLKDDDLLPNKPHNSTIPLKSKFGAKF